MKSPNNSRSRRVALIVGVIVALSILYVSRASAAVYDEAPRIDLGPGALPYYTASGDFNSDGRPDLAVADYAGNVQGATDRVLVYFGDGRGAFTFDEAYGGMLNPSDLVVADFDNDGHEDIAVHTEGAKSVQFLKGSASGRLGNVGGFAPDATVYDIEVGDFNNDGIADLVATGFGTVVISLGKGNFEFTSTKNFPLVFFQGIAVADFDGDGRDDVATTFTASPAKLVTARSLGDGKLGSWVPSAFPGAPTDLSVGDFNGDGRPDIAGSIGATHRVAVRTGTGSGAFTTSLPDVIVGNRPEEVTVADVDADGHDDLLTANADQNSVSVRFGKGDGTFGAEDEITGGEEPVSLTPADFNLDGVTDWAAGNLKGTGVTVRLGNSKPLLDGNLLVNGGFEAAGGARLPSQTAPIPGWTTAGGITTIRYGSTPHNGFPTQLDAAQHGHGGLNFLWGGGNPLPGGITTATQEIDLSASAPSIDTGKGEANLSADLGGGLNYADNFTVTASFLDGGGKVLGEVQVGPVTHVERRGITTLLRRAAKKALPISTRRIRVTATSHDNDTVSSAIADNLKLTLDLPPAPPTPPTPPAQPDNPTPEPGAGGGGEPGPGTGMGPGGGPEPTTPQPTTPRAFGASAKVTLTLAPKRSQKRGTVAVLVRNRNGFAVQGTLTGKSGKGRKAVKVKGVRVVLAAGGKSTVRLKLPAKLRRELKRRGRVAIQLDAAVSDPAGNKRNVRKRISTKLR